MTADTLLEKLSEYTVLDEDDDDRVLLTRDGQTAPASNA
jgi:hypothetical protein